MNTKLKLYGLFENIANEIHSNYLPLIKIGENESYLNSLIRPSFILLFALYSIEHKYLYAYILNSWLML